MLVQTDDVRVVMDFCYRDPVQFRPILHDLEAVCPEWDEAMANYGKTVEEIASAPKPAPVF